MATKKTLIVPADRTDLIDLLRPLVDDADDRCNLTDLALISLGHIEALVKSDPERAEWHKRTARGALADRIYAELSLLLKAKRLDVTLPFLRSPIAINPRQGVRLKGMKEYQQTLFLAFTWDEYEAWRGDWLARFEKTAGIREIIYLIDRVRLTNPHVPNILAALQLGGARVAAVMEDVA